MDRQIVYPGQVLPETTLLQITKDVMIALAKVSGAVFGTSTVANGFAVSPTAPATLQVSVAAGEIYSLQNVDGTAFSTLAADTTHQIVKQGIALDATLLTLAAPGTAGQSINYLIEATYQDTDSTPALLPYYNTSTPSYPYSGLGNNGLTQNTSRKGAVVLQAKAGVSAATGSQTTPSPDSGYVGLCVVTVAYGQTQILAANIAAYSAAPLLTTGLLQSIQSGNLTFGTDVGTAGVIQATYPIPVTALVDNMECWVKTKYANPGATTFTPNPGVIPAYPVVGGAHVALQGGEIVPSGRCGFIWRADITSWVLIEQTGGAVQVPNATSSQQAVTLGQMTSAIPNMVGPRNTVQCGGALLSAGSGLAVNLLAAAVPVNVAIAAGYGATGQLDYIARLTADQASFWSGLTASVTNFLFVDRNTSTGAITGVSSVLPYAVAWANGAAPTSVASTTSGQHTYVADAGQMYVGTGSSATLVQRVPVGECAAGASAVTSVTPYAFNGHFDSGLFAVSASSAYTKTHNLGVSAYNVDITMADDASGTSERTAYMATYQNSGYVGYFGTGSSRNSYSLATAAGVGVGTGDGTVTTSYFRVRVRRAF